MAVPYTFGSATSSIPLSQLDSNFATGITLGNTAIQLGNTVTTLNNMTLANVTISSGTSSLTSTSISNGTSNVTIASSGGNISMATNGATAITIDTSQRVGIGTTAPNKPLSVYGGDGYIQMLNASTGTGNTDGAFIGVEGGTTGLRIVNQENDVISFSTNGLANERMRITSGGNLLVGTTTNSLSTKIFTNSNIGAQQTYGPMYVSNEDNTDNVGRSSFDFKRGGTLVGLITTTNSACSYVSVSDYRLKENVTPMTGALAKVAQLKPVTYKWKKDGTDGQGFIAHELQAIVPDCVVGEKDAVEENGDIKPQGIDTSFLVATLTSAIQELKAINDTQAETINALTARIVALESK